VIAPSDNGSCTIESRANGYMLDVAKNSTSDGAAIDEWHTNGATNQQWTLVKVS